MKKFFILFVSLMALAGQAQAATDWSFSNLTQSDVDGVAKDMAANTSLHTVMPASALGSVWGFELGIAGGRTGSPNVNAVAQRTNSATNVANIYHAGILGAVTVPFGFTIEAMYLPTQSVSDVKYQQSNVALKWTFTDVLMEDTPVNMAVRAFYGRSQLDWDQTRSGITFTATSKNEVNGYQFLISPKLIPVIEPYLGFGMARANSSLEHNAGASVPVFSDGSTNKSSSLSTSQFIAGIDAKLLFFGLGLEYVKGFDTASTTAKFSMKF